MRSMGGSDVGEGGDLIGKDYEKISVGEIQYKKVKR